MENYETPFKIIIVIFLFLITYFIYKKTNWQAVPAEKKWNNSFLKKVNVFLDNHYQTNISNLLIYFYVIIFGLPMCLAIFYIICFLIYGIQFIYCKLDFWEEILFYFSFICLGFSIKIYIDEKSTNEYIMKKIFELEDKMRKNQKKN